MAALAAGESELARAAAIDPCLEGPAARAAAAALELADLTRELWSYLDGLEADPGGWRRSMSAWTGWRA